MPAVPTFIGMKTGMRSVLSASRKVRAAEPRRQIDLNAVGEAKLVALCQAGDRTAFDALVKSHGVALRSFVSRRAPAEHVDDVVQDTWVAAWSSLGGYTVRAKFRTWVYAIAANKCRDLHRRPATVSVEVEQGQEEAEYGRVELRHVVGEVLCSLGPVHREVLDLYYYEQLTLAEIAEVTGRNLNTVKYQFYRAHKAFADLIDEVPHG